MAKDCIIYCLRCSVLNDGSIFCSRVFFSNKQRSPPFAANQKMFNAIKCAYWTSTALSHYQKIEIVTKITRHNEIYAGNVKRHYTVCAFYWLCSCSLYCKIVQLCCVCSEESETASSCSGDVKKCCGFLSMSSHDMASNTISHGTQKYPVDDYSKVPLAPCLQSA